MSFMAIVCNTGAREQLVVGMIEQSLQMSKCFVYGDVTALTIN